MFCRLKIDANFIYISKSVLLCLLVKTENLKWNLKNFNWPHQDLNGFQKKLGFCLFRQFRGKCFESNAGYIVICDKKIISIQPSEHWTVHISPFLDHCFIFDLLKFRAEVFSQVFFELGYDLVQKKYSVLRLIEIMWAKFNKCRLLELPVLSTGYSLNSSASILSIPKHSHLGTIILAS
jgi:hypothetical protein